MSAANEAAAGLVPDLVTELVEKIPVRDDDILAADLAQATGQSVEAAPQGSSSQEAAVAQPEGEQETAVEFPDYTPELPDDLAAELDEPDFEEEAINEDLEGEDEIAYDEQDTEERRKRIAAEKRAAWLEGRLAETNRKKWEAEAKKYFPLAEHAIKNIKADSRRKFLREAKAAHESVLPYVQPLIEKLNEAAELVKQQAKEEGRQEAAAAWGKPTTGPGAVPVAASASASELEAARKSRNLAKIVGVLMKQSQ